MFQLGQEICSVRLLAMPEARNDTADLLKGTAVVLMIQVHVMELFARPEIQASAVGKASLFLGGPPVAPVFMVVMGYFAFASRRTLVQAMIRAVGLFATGMILNIGLNLHLLIRIYQGTIRLDPWMYVFGIDILILASIATAAIALLRIALKDRWWLWLLLAVTTSVTSPLLVEQLTTDSPAKWLLACLGGNYTWSYFSVFPWLAYPLLGAAVSAWHDRNVDCPVAADWRSAIWCAAVAMLLWTGLFAVETSHSLPAFYNHGPSFFAWTTTFLFVWTRAAHRLSGIANHSFGAWLSWMGRNVTACYIVQWLIIGNTATAIYKTESLLHCVLWVVTIVATTCGVVYLLLGRRSSALARPDS
jgi:uncharacterized membrane protein